MSESEKIARWIRDWFEEHGRGAKAVIGISGGKDSTVTAALLVKALGKDRVHGVIMPNGEMPDTEDALEVVHFLDIPYSVINIRDAYEGLLKAIGQENHVTQDMKINIPPRLRMTTLYAVAQSFEEGGRVANTCNASEDYVGYSTKYGDAAGDFSPLSSFTVTEVLAIGDEMGLPSHLVHKVPSDGLSGMSDEDKLGFTYEALDRYIRTGVCEDPETKEKIDRKHKANLHKLLPMPVYRPEK